MARYTSFFTIAVRLDKLRQVLPALLKSCNFDIIYDSEDYLVAREIPGGVVFSKLVTVEILIDRLQSTQEAVKMNFVVKNEELPLNADNHCRRMSNLINRTISENPQWRLIECVAG